MLLDATLVYRSLVSHGLTLLRLEPTLTGEHIDSILQDSSSFASEGEEVSFLQLQARAMEVSQVLVGFYDIPKSVEQPLQLVINPEVLTESPGLFKTGSIVSLLWTCK